MSRRQSERLSRFQVEIDDGIRVAAALFRDNDADASVRAAVRLWCTTRMRGRRFAELVREARELTQERISIGAIQRREAGRREAMPYFLAVLRDLAVHDRQSRNNNSTE